MTIFIYRLCNNRSKAITSGVELIGQALASSDRIAKIAFTGSTAVGHLILANAAKTLIPSTVELGGKSPNIVLEDADLEAAVAAVEALRGMEALLLDCRGMGGGDVVGGYPHHHRGLFHWASSEGATVRCRATRFRLQVSPA